MVKFTLLHPERRGKVIPVALIKAKNLKSFGLSECKRANKGDWGNFQGKQLCHLNFAFLLDGVHLLKEFASWRKILSCKSRFIFRQLGQQRK